MKNIFKKSFKASKHGNSGFTIVELLVVIVVIGVLSGLMFVMYSGVSQKAISSSLQSDLISAASKLKLFQTSHDAYPAAINDCPSPSSSNLCLKVNDGNTFAYSYDNATNPQSFTLDATNTNGTKYRITNTLAPVLVPISSGVAATGGTITDSGGYRTHTFTSNGSLTITTGGNVEVTINGGGGGGGGGQTDYEDGTSGDNGGATTVTYPSGGTNYIAYGGYGGVGCSHSCGPSGGTGGGTNTPSGWTSTTGGAGNAGGGGEGGGDGWCCHYGQDGGNGGTLYRAVFALSDSSVMNVVIGGGGGGGTPDGGGGSDGSVTVRYPH